MEVAVIREDRLLLAELGRLNTDVVPLAMRIMDDSAPPGSTMPSLSDWRRWHGGYGHGEHRWAW
jgi:hypothetical protein